MSISVAEPIAPLKPLKGPLSLSGKVALITGGARGQGAAEARLFAELGASVVVADVLMDEACSVAREMGDAGIAVKLDVASEEDWRAAVNAAIERFGKLDVLVNNAGVTHFARLTDTSVADYRRVIEVNQVGVFLGMRSVVAAMTQAGGGSIINISSVEGLIGTPGLTAYTASKFAVRGMTKVAALELASLGIRVNSVHPGFIDTLMLQDPNVVASGAVEIMSARIPLARIAEPREAASLVAFLASDLSSYCSGSEFVVDGGLTAGITL